MTLNRLSSRCYTITHYAPVPARLPLLRGNWPVHSKRDERTYLGPMRSPAWSAAVRVYRKAAGAVAKAEVVT